MRTRRLNARRIAAPGRILRFGLALAAAFATLGLCNCGSSSDSGSQDSGQGPAITLSSIVPAAAPAGTIVAVKLQGGSFLTSSQAWVHVSGTGVSQDGDVTVSSGTEMTVRLKIDAAAPLGPRTLAVENGGLVSGTQVFTVLRNGTAQGFELGGGVCVDASHIYVADDQGPVRMDAMNGANARVLDRGSARYIFTAGSAVYYTDGSAKSVKRVDAGGNVTSFGTYGNGFGQFDDPRGLWVDASGRIYVADPRTYRVIRVDGMTGGSWTEIKGDFYNPVSVAVDSVGHVIVGTADGHLLRYDGMDRRTQRMLMRPNGTPVEFGGEVHIWLDATHIYVADTANNRIVRMDNNAAFDGSGLVPFGTEGSGEFAFRHPSGITAGPDGRIYVADQGNGRIVRIDDMSGTGWVETSTYTIP